MGNEESQRTDACRRFDAEVATYIEGEARPFVPAHAAECRFCEVLLTDLEAIRSASGSLPLEEPPVAVWANLRAALRSEGIIHEPLSIWDKWFGSMGLIREHAPLGALAGLLVLAFTMLNTPKGPRQSAETDRARGTNVASAALVFPDQRQLDITLQELENSFEAREASLDPSLQATYARGLESLNESIRECAELVRRQPENTLAREYLLAAYTQKAEVLETALEYDAH